MGPVRYKIFYGCVNEEKFNNFVVNELIDVIGSYPNPNSIILVDNCSYHGNDTFKWIINKSINVWCHRSADILTAE